MRQMMSEYGQAFVTEASRLREAGVGTMPIMDYLICGVGTVPVSEWADARGVQDRTVEKSLKKVANETGEAVVFPTSGGEGDDGDA